ncbi:hypothetical protein ACFQJC_02375 [Haloferax namakaokahaiae]|uniref:Uncharacterized protein n=1 Tax=Haloferax namakaokahaiae TaxID=1748331 RepID=A0ABD5ZAN5_9EURY
MPPVLDTIPFDVLYFVTAAILVGAVGYGVVRWLTSDDSSPPPESKPAESYGYPLASWRYVYDVDKDGAKRELQSVHEQAETLSKADEKRR